MAYPEMKRNKTMEMINTFETTDMKVLIEDVTSAGSAFGSNKGPLCSLVHAWLSEWT